MNHEQYYLMYTVMIHYTHASRSPAARETAILEKALAALPRTAGLHGRITEVEPHRATCGDALIEIKTANRAYPFVADVKNVRHFATISLVKEQLVCAKRGVQPLLVAPYITRALVEQCRAVDLPFSPFSPFSPFFEISNLRAINSLHGFDSRRLHQV